MELENGTIIEVLGQKIEIVEKAKAIGKLVTNAYTVKKAKGKKLGRMIFKSTGKNYYMFGQESVSFQNNEVA